MKRIGLLGGMSWESSAEYYRLVNEATRDRLGGLHSADCVLRSVDFAEIAELQRHGAWEQAGRRLAAEAVAGAELLVLCTNTMHKVADAIAPSASRTVRNGRPLRWRISKESRQAARRKRAPAGAKGWLRVSICQMASVSLRERSIWATLGPRWRPR